MIYKYRSYWPFLLTKKGRFVIRRAHIDKKVDRWKENIQEILKNSWVGEWIKKCWEKKFKN